MTEKPSSTRFACCDAGSQPAQDRKTLYWRERSGVSASISQSGTMIAAKVNEKGRKLSFGYTI
jgi:hypothetical protein